MHNSQDFAPEPRIFLATQQDTELATEYDSCIHAFRSSNADRDVAWVQTPDKANCIILFEEWSTKFWNYPQTLLADPFFIKYWQSIVTINCDDLGRGFLPGCYTSLIPANFDRTLHCASAYPYTYNHLVQQSQSYQSAESKWLFEFIQYLDSDDLLLPKKFEFQVSGLRQCSDCAVSYGKTRFYAYGDRPTDQPWKRTGEQIPTMFPSFLQSRWWDTSTPLYVREVTDLAGPWTELRNEEDWEYDCRIASKW